MIGRRLVLELRLPTLFALSKFLTNNSISRRSLNMSKTIFSVFSCSCSSTPCKGGFPLGEMNGDFAVKSIWACAFLFVYSLAGKVFIFKIVKIDFTNSQRKNSPRSLDQSKHKYISFLA